MKTFVKVLFLLLLGQQAYAQHIYQIRADSVRIYNVCDTAELIIENRTRDVNGFLYNKNNGRTEFRRLRLESVGGSRIAISGQDTLDISTLPGIGGIDTIYRSGDNILYKKKDVLHTIYAPLPSFKEIPQGVSYTVGDYPASRITGFNAYSSPDMPPVSDQALTNPSSGNSYYTGHVVRSGSTGYQMAVNWDGELTGPKGVFIRNKDDTKTTWGAWRELIFKDYADGKYAGVSSLQTSGQAQVHWNNITNRPQSFPTTSDLQTVTDNGAITTNSLEINPSGAAFRALIIKRLVNGATASAQIANNNYTSLSWTPDISVPLTTYRVDIGTGTLKYYNAGSHADIWRSDNHVAGSAFNPDLSGARVLQGIMSNASGHIVGMNTRVLTPGDIGAVALFRNAQDWNSFSGTTTSTFNENSGNAPTATTYFGLNVNGGIGNAYGAQLALRNNTYFFRTLENGTYGSWLQVADRSWVGDNYAAVTPSPSSWSGFLTIPIGRFMASATGAPNAGIWHGLHMGGDASNAAQIAFKNGTGYFRTYDAGAVSSWLQFADRSWVTNNFAASGGSGSYIQNQISAAQSSSNFWVTGVGRTSNNFQVTKDGSNAFNQSIWLLNAAQARGVNLQLNGDANPGLATWIHNGNSWVKRMEMYANGNTSLFSNLTLPTGGALIGGSVGIGAVTTPAFNLHVVSSSTGGFAIQNNTAISTATGAFARLYQNGIPTAADQRFGGVLMGPASGVNYYTGAQIEARSAGTWTAGSSHPSYLSFLVGQSGSTVFAEPLRLSATQVKANVRTFFPSLSGVAGTGTGVSNGAYLAFYESNGTTRQGYVGKGSGSNYSIYLQSDHGNIEHVAPNGDININANGVMGLTNNTKNTIVYNGVGVQAPTTTTRSAGAKIVLYPGMGPSNTDYAIGIESGHHWYGVNANSTSQGFKWYGGTTEIARMDGTGNFKARSLTSNNGTVNSYLTFSGSGNVGVVGTSTAHPFAIYASGIERMRANTGGNILIGTTTDNSTDKLQVNGSVSAAGSMTATSFYQTSLRSLKTNIHPFVGSAIAILASAQVRTFQFKADNTGKTNIGFIADEVPDEIAIPERKGVDQASIVALLVKSVQELKQENERLRDDNAALQQRMKDFEASLEKLLHHQNK